MKMTPKVGDVVYVETFKHDGSVHRTWSSATVLDVKQDLIVAMTYKTWVVEGDGRRWFTKEPAICFYYKDRWYNVMAMIRKRGIYYYSNLASPSLYDGEAIKYIDYDLDVKVFPDGHYILLDDDEFLEHQKLMKYEDEIIEIILAERMRLVNLVKDNAYPFRADVIYGYFDRYLSLGDK